MSQSSKTLQRGSQPSVSDPAIRLTRHTIRIVVAIGMGARPEDIAKTLGTTPGTVYEQLRDIRCRLGAQTNAEVVRLALHHGFVGLDTDGAVVVGRGATLHPHS